MFSKQEIESQWIGTEPALEEDIICTEERLGVKLPLDVIKLYRITNGTSVILNQTFCGFMPIQKIDWLKKADPYLIECYSEMGEEYVEDLNNSIIIAGLEFPHSILIIQPFGKHEDWRYWEFASYVPGETPFGGIMEYLERINQFLSKECSQE